MSIQRSAVLGAAGRGGAAERARRRRIREILAVRRADAAAGFRADPAIRPWAAPVAGARPDPTH